MKPHLEAANSNRRRPRPQPRDRHRESPPAPVGPKRRINQGSGIFTVVAALAIFLSVGGGVGVATTIVSPSSPTAAFGLGVLCVVPVTLASVVAWFIVFGAAQAARLLLAARPKP